MGYRRPEAYQFVWCCFMVFVSVLIANLQNNNGKKIPLHNTQWSIQDFPKEGVDHLVGEGQDLTLGALLMDPPMIQMPV